MGIGDRVKVEGCFFFLSACFLAVVWARKEESVRRRGFPAVSSFRDRDRVYVFAAISLCVIKTRKKYLTDKNKLIFLSVCNTRIFSVDFTIFLSVITQLKE